jgi:hypothetical protein
MRKKGNEIGRYKVPFNFFIIVIIIIIIIIIAVQTTRCIEQVLNQSLWR